MGQLVRAARRLGAGLALGGLLLCPGVGAAQDAAATHTLRLKFAKGEVCKYRMVMDMEADMMGQEMGVRMEQEYEQKVASVDADGVGTLDCKITRVAMEMSVPMMGLEMSFDSAKDTKTEAPAAADEPADPMAMMTGMMKRIFRVMVGKPFTMVQAPDGKVRKVTGITKMLEEAIPADDPMGEVMKMQMERSVSDEAMAKQMTANGLALPKDPVAVGGTWAAAFEMDNPGMPGQSMKFSSTCTLDKVEGETAEISTKLSIKGADAPAGGEGDGGGEGMAGIMGKLDASGTGKITFDIAGGILNELTQTITMKMGGAEGGEDGGGGMGGQSKIKMSLKRLSRTAVTQGF